mgnify:FL=1
MRYRLSTATAYHANRALSHTVWAIAIVAGAVTSQKAFGTVGALTTVSLAWAGYEGLKAALSAARARRAGYLEKQVPTFSVYEGRFVSVGLEGGEDH